MCMLQPGLSAEEKDLLNEQVLVLVTSLAPSETLVITVDFNGHAGQHSQGFSRHHGGYGYGTRNQEGLRVLDLCAATDLAVTNTFFRKRNSHLVTDNTGGYSNQVDYILVRRTDLKLVKNANVIGNEECILQRKLLVAVLKIQTPSEKPFIAAKRNLWRLCEPEVQAEYQNFIKERADVKPSCLEDAWNKLKDCLLSGVDKVCGKTKGGRVRHNETWWWNDVVNDVVKEKRRKWKQWKVGGNKDEYQLAKKGASHAVYKAKQHAQSEYFRDINTSNGRNKIFKMAHTIKDTNKDVTGEKCVCYDKGNLTISDEAKLYAWKEHYQRLINVDFPWDKNSLNNSAAVEGPATFVIENIVTEAIKMKQVKARGPSGVIVEMIKAGGRETFYAISELVNLII